MSSLVITSTAFERGLRIWRCIGQFRNTIAYHSISISTYLHVTYIPIYSCRDDERVSRLSRVQPASRFCLTIFGRLMVGTLSRLATRFATCGCGAQRIQTSLTGERKLTPRQPCCCVSWLLGRFYLDSAYVNGTLKDSGMNTWTSMTWQPLSSHRPQIPGDDVLRQSPK